MAGVQVLGYAVAGGLLIMSPGPDFAVVLRNGLGGGRRSASAAGAGVASGLVLWSVAVATGLGALLAASATVYTAIKLAGVGYLLYLGISSLRAAPRGGSHRPDVDSGPAERSSMVRSYRQGLLSNALNPKVAVTFLALMPQFLPRHPDGAQLLVLCLVTLAIGGVWFQVVATIIGGFRRVFARERVRRALDAATGAVLVAFGIRLATD